jgi:ribosomal protein S20
MPIIKSAIKRSKQALVHRDRNVGIKRDIKSALKTFLAKPSAASLSAAHSELDTAVKKGLLKKNTVARRKAGLAKVAKDAGVKLAASTTAKKAPVKTTTVKSATAKPAAKKPTATKSAAPAKKPAVKKTTK